MSLYNNCLGTTSDCSFFLSLLQPELIPDPLCSIMRHNDGDHIAMDLGSEMVIISRLRPRLAIAWVKKYEVVLIPDPDGLAQCLSKTMRPDSWIWDQ